MMRADASTIVAPRGAHARQQGTDPYRPHANLDTVDRVILAALCVLAFAVGLVTSHVGPAVDTWRDLYNAHLIASGQAFPAAGPIIGRIAHLGPVWFYLLAIPLALGGVAGALGAIGFIAALKFPLGYLVGRRLFGRPTALAMIPALAMPGWFQFDVLWLTHTSAVSSVLLGLVLVALWYREKPGAVRAAAVGLLCGLAVHAHPTTLLLAAIAGIWALTGAMAWRSRLAHAAIIAAPGIALLLPQLLGLLTGTNDDARTIGAFVSAGPNPVLARLPALIAGLFWTGPGIVIDFWLASEPWSVVLRTCHALALALALVGLVLDRVDGRRMPLLLVGLLVIQSLFVLALREKTPYWMTFAHGPIVALLLARGWVTAWERLVHLRPTLVAVAAVYGLLYLLLLRFAIAPPLEVRFPTFPVGSPGLMSVGSRPSGVMVAANPVLPVRSVDQLGAALCGGAVVYGHLGVLIDASNGLGVRRRCESSDGVFVGGAPRPGVPAIVGLAESAQRALARDERLADGLWLAPIRSYLGRGVNLPISDIRTLPNRDFVGFVPSRETLELRVPSDSMIVVAHRAFGHYPFAATVRAESGRMIEPVYQDMFLSIYAPDDLNHVTEVWRIEIAAVLELVDVLIVDRPGARADGPREARGLSGSQAASIAGRCSASRTATVASAVRAVPPMSGVSTPALTAASTACSTSRAAASSPSEWRSSIASAEPQGRLARGYRVSQGREIGRDARLRVRIDDPTSAWVGGQTRTVIDGRLGWPD